MQSISQILKKQELKDIHRKKAPPNETTALSKSMNMDISVVGRSNQLFYTRFLNWNKIFEKIK